MDWQLLDYAKEAEDTGAVLQVVLSEIPQYRKDITGNIAELYAISNALHVLHEALELARYGRAQSRIQRDLAVCLPSLGHTLDDVQDMFSKKKLKSRSAPGAFPGSAPYADLWETSLADLKQQGMPLPVRLELFRSHLQGMHDALRGKEDEDDLRTIRSRLSKLLKKQEPLDSYFNRLSVHGQGHDGYAHTPKPPSPKVPRPNLYSYSTYPAQVYAHPQSPQLPPPPHYPHAPTWGGVIGDIPFIPPQAPDIPHISHIPQSPTYSSASSQAYSNHSSESEPVAHWAMKIFNGRHTQTSFQTFAEPTVCVGKDETRVIELLDSDGFEKVLELPFEATDVLVRLYWRPKDGRARILFLTEDSRGNRMRYCLPLTGLKLLRNESCLQLCRVNRKDGQLDLWARLRFTMYERMVLFYCTAVAMKRQDQTGVAEELKDFFDPGEKREFAGEVTHGQFRHAFRIFRDVDSGCVRFEATPRRGPLNSIPIWTAFVTQYIGYRNWMKRVGAATVQFKELHPYVFCDGYRLPKGPTNKYQLTFTSSEDAKHFMEQFHKIRR